AAHAPGGARRHRGSAGAGRPRWHVRARAVEAAAGVWATTDVSPSCPASMTIPTNAQLYAQAQALGERLRASRDSLVTAESCTGGWIAKCLTDIPGSSDWFDCGLVVYSYEAKQGLLGVHPQTLEEHGAVSRETAIEMVSGALVKSGASVAVAVTGIAGPGG